MGVGREALRPAPVTAAATGAPKRTHINNSPGGQGKVLRAKLRSVLEMPSGRVPVRCRLVNERPIRCDVMQDVKRSRIAPEAGKCDGYAVPGAAGRRWLVLGQTCSI